MEGVELRRLRPGTGNGSLGVIVRPVTHQLARRGLRCRVPVVTAQAGLGVTLTLNRHGGSGADGAGRERAAAGAKTDSDRRLRVLLE